MQVKTQNRFLDIDFLSKRIVALIIFTIVVITGSILYLQTGFTLGTDFSGGIRIEFSSPGNVQDLRTTINQEQIALTTLKYSDGSENFLLTAPASLGKEGSGEYLLDSLKEKYGTDNIVILSANFIGPSVGTDFVQQALKLLSIVTALILVYVAFRFDFLYGMGAISALLHDMIIMMVTTLIFKIPIDLTVLAAFLTILGYSINDTIVIFDRIRENHSILPNEDYAKVINKSIGQSFTRTILTSITTLFVATSIFVWAGSTLKSFGLLLIIGIISGTYSSIFVASPITYLTWKKFHKTS